MAVSIPVIEMAMHKSSDFLQGLACFGQPGSQGMEDMGHALPDL
tara:strand:+ start:1537 stop:1668 length:132 start_codon:yes stop_codon:yes gene_type:complete